MSNPSVISLTLAAASANAIALAQALAAAGNLTLNGALVTAGVATLDVARRVVMASTGNDAGVTFTVTGTDRYGNSQTDTITGLNASSANTVKDFQTVTKIASSAATVGNITAGTNGIGSTEWVLDNFLAPFWALAVAVVVSGTVTFTVEHTYDDPNAVMPGTGSASANTSMEPGSFVPPTVWSLAALTGKSANTEAQFSNQPIFAHRLTISSGTGKATMQSIQAGIGSV